MQRRGSATNCVSDERDHRETDRRIALAAEHAGIELSQHSIRIKPGFQHVVLGSVLFYIAGDDLFAFSDYTDHWRQPHCHPQVVLNCKRSVINPRTLLQETVITLRCPPK